MIDWKNQNVRFAVGVTAGILGLYLVFSGDGMLAIAAFSAEPAEGETKSGTVWSIVWPILFNVFVIIGTGVIAFVTKVFDWLGGLSQRSAAVQVAPNGSQVMPINEAADKLIKAIARGETEEEAKLRPLVRVPYAQQQAFEAMQAGDFERARKLLAEVEAMAGGKSK